MHRTIGAVLTSLLVTVLLNTAAAQSMQAWTGTWKLNLAKGVNGVGKAARRPQQHHRARDGERCHADHH